MESNIHNLTTTYETAAMVATVHRQRMIEHVIQLVNHHPLFVAEWGRGDNAGTDASKLDLERLNVDCKIYSDHFREDMTVHSMTQDGRLIIGHSCISDLVSLGDSELLQFIRQMDRALIYLQVKAEVGH